MKRLKEVLPGKVLLAGGLILSCVLLYVGGYALTSYTLPMRKGQWEQAATSSLGNPPLAMYNQALQLMKERNPQAKKLLSDAFTACLDDSGEVRPKYRQLAASIKFSQGNLLVAMEEMQGAVDAYCESLRLEPNNLSVKYNLELLLTPRGGAGKGGTPKIVPGSQQNNKQGI